MKKRLLICTAVLLPVGTFLWLWAHTESYCFFYPGIDTQYAPGYSESAFNKVTPGMSVQEVKQLLGDHPLSDELADGRVVASYTWDGKCSIGKWYYADFAWLGREIYFRDGRVVEVVKRVYYD